MDIYLTRKYQFKFCHIISLKISKPKMNYGPHLKTDDLSRLSLLADVGAPPSDICAAHQMRVNRETATSHISL